MNIVVVQGMLSSEPTERTLASGVTVLNWDVSVKTDGAKQSVPVVWNDAPKSVQAYDKGDHVVVLGSVNRRYFNVGGTTASRTEVIGEAVAKPTQRVRAGRLFERARLGLSEQTAP